MQQRLQVQRLLLPVAAASALLEQKREQKQEQEQEQEQEPLKAERLQLLEEALGSAGGRARRGIWAALLLERCGQRRWSEDAGDTARCRCRTSLQHAVALLVMLKRGGMYVKCHLK